MNAFFVVCPPAGRGEGAGLFLARVARPLSRSALELLTSRTCLGVKTTFPALNSVSQHLFFCQLKPSSLISVNSKRLGKSSATRDDHVYRRGLEATSLAVGHSKSPGFHHRHRTSWRMDSTTMASGLR